MPAIARRRLPRVRREEGGCNREDKAKTKHRFDWLFTWKSLLRVISVVCESRGLWKECAFAREKASESPSAGAGTLRKSRRAKVKSAAQVQGRGACGPLETALWVCYSGSSVTAFRDLLHLRARGHTTGYRRECFLLSRSPLHAPAGCCVACGPGACVKGSPLPPPPYTCLLCKGLFLSRPPHGDGCTPVVTGAKRFPQRHPESAPFVPATHLC